VPARHLGLVPAGERGAEADEVVARLAALGERCLDLDGLLALARLAPRITASPWDPATEIASTRPVGTGPAEAAEPPVVAMAGGRAFTFRYTETAELLRASGAAVAEFDPAADEDLPPGTAALYLGGGFPEVHADQLSANEPMRRAIAAAAAAGTPVMAECAGLLYLCRTLDGVGMAGVLDADARMTENLTLGYRTAHTLDGGLLDDAGATIPAHEFHRTSVTPEHGEAPAWRVDGDRLEGWTRPSRLHASYLHVHWAGAPQAARRFVAAAHEARGLRTSGYHGTAVGA
jgi:cobyrinic acid a,c-diamide synthase